MSSGHREGVDFDSPGVDLVHTLKTVKGLLLLVPYYLCAFV
jgi:hypothetical protein